MANYFQIFPPLFFSYQLFIFTNRGNFQARTWVWRKFAAVNRVKEGIGQESNGAANQEKQIFLLCQISPSASSTRDLGTRLDYRHDYRLWLLDMITIKKHAPWSYMGWLPMTLSVLAARWGCRCGFRNSLYAFHQSEKRQWVQCIIICIVIPPN